jgi:hypothetical protein
VRIISLKEIILNQENAEVRKKILNYQEKDRSKDMEVLITNY